MKTIRSGLTIDAAGLQTSLMAKASGLGTADLRETNRKIVLRAIWLNHQISRADVARITRINKSSISDIVNDLILEGLVIEATSETTQIGRTPIHLFINAPKYHFLAIDIRPSGISAAVYDLSGKQVADTWIPLPGKSPERVLEAAADTLLDLCRLKRIPMKSLRALGAAIPGQISRDEGLVIRSPALDWTDVPAERILSDRLGRVLESSFDNSANHAVRAELWRGEEVPENLTGIYIDLNETMESGIILDGKILSGRKFGTGSFGQMRLWTSSPEGKPSATWEESVALAGLVERFRGMEQHKVRSLAENLAELRQAAIDGDPLALSLLDAEARLIAAGLSNIIASLAFPTIILGGMIRIIWDVIEERVLSECESLTNGEYPRSHQIRLSSLAKDEALEGAALAAIGKVIPLDLLSLLTNQQKDLIESKVLKS
jgi:predicted NBD/HSP70 family sugar kinase